MSDLLLPNAQPPMPYRVLARKYRPTNFDDLIGQDVLVRTLSNAIASGRIAHAFVLTGIRGIGKTTTARIIARALNCIGPDELGGPTITPCGVCTHCVSIGEDRNVDVIEMDAASHTGVDDVRDIIDRVQYLPVSARYKIFIIDEVHMLSKNAFNALLNTLEEPPPHVKFIFATTESRKIPVTILSRCQRFDLKRITTEMLASHLANICAKESVQAEEEALKLIAVAAEGSVRDSLSLLDQAIARANPITTGDIRHMLGAVDNTAMFELLRALLSGEVAPALDRMRALYNAGSDPLAMVQESLELVHLITRTKINREAVMTDVALSEHDRTQADQMAGHLSMPVLARLWQMLLKGLQEVKFAPSPVAALEMLLVRVAYAAELPTPADLVRKLQDAPVAMTQPASPSAVLLPMTPKLAAVATTATVASPQTFRALVALFEEKREALLAITLREHARLVSFAPGHLSLNISPAPARDFAAKVADHLKQWTGEEWKISLSDAAGEATLFEQDNAHKEQLKQQAASHPLVASVLEQFPGAQIMQVKG